MNYRIAAVDDEKTVRDLLRRTLEPAGFSVETYANGEEALQGLKKITPDLILLDIRMPGMSGIELLEHLSSKHSGIPVFMLTSTTDIESTNLAIQKGARDYLLKPFDTHHLVSYITSYLQKFKAA